MKKSNNNIHTPAGFKSKSHAGDPRDLYISSGDYIALIKGATKDFLEEFDRNIFSKKEEVLNEKEV